MLFLPRSKELFHCFKRRGVGASRRRGTTKKDREREAPETADEIVMPIVWAMRIGSGVSDILRPAIVDYCCRFDGR